MATDAIGDERPTLFLRNATGLVRGWSVRDSMIYACLSTNVITLGLVEFAYQDAFPSRAAAHRGAASRACGCRSSSSPTAGSSSRSRGRAATTCGRPASVGSGLGFVMAATGWWFILWLWAPIYGSVLAEEFFQPLWATFNDPSGAAWFGTHTGIVRRHADHDRAGRRPGLARHGRVREGAEVVLLRRPARRSRSS